MRAVLITAFVLGALAVRAAPNEPAHSHPPPEKLGTAHFATSCARGVQGQFDHAVALLHSFAYDIAAREFRQIAAADPGCAMAHWGVAMSAFHQLWTPPGAGELQLGREELLAAHQVRGLSGRENELIHAAAVYFSDLDPTRHASRANEYARAMQSVAEHFPSDDEVQVFYALALIATAPPTDRSHANQKRAAEILEPIYHRLPDHPGVAHYLIHAYDSSELAPRGLPAARAYAQIAPSAPHALHMPSHIFTRLGLWEDSIRSNEAARRAAHEQGDIGEELHAMDYLTYAYLQLGRADDAAKVVADLREMSGLQGNFKAGYAATAMPTRLAIERGDWKRAVSLEPAADAPPEAQAVAVWARAIGFARLGNGNEASVEAAKLAQLERQLRNGGKDY